MSLTTSSVTAAWFLDGVAKLQRAQVKTQKEISSGYRVQDAADSPEQTRELVGLVSSFSVNQSWQSSLSRVQAEATSADNALSVAIKLVESARTLALQGAGSIPTASDRQVLAVQVKSIQEQIVSLANTTTEGRFIFGGDQDLSAPYQLNPANTSGVDKLTTQTSTRVIPDPAGQPVYKSATAADIFDPRDQAGAPLPDNTFVALQSLLASLQNNDPAGISTALQSLKSVSDRLNQKQSVYGFALNRITAELTNAQSESTTLQTQISAIRDTDVVKAASDLSAENFAQSAAFSAQARISGKSLFDYLG
jgi:flagellar hook-associated protein 3 FlgL